MSIKIKHNTRNSDSWNEIVFHGHITRSNCFLTSKLPEMKEADYNTLILDSCYFGSTNSRNAETVIDIENVSSFAITHSYLYNCITDSCFSPDFVNIHDSHLTECNHFRIGVSKNLSVMNSSLHGIGICFLKSANVYCSNASFSSCCFLDSGKNDGTENAKTRDIRNCMFNAITVESRAFVNVSFERCIFACIFARANQGYPDYSKPFKNCTFKNCHFENLDPYGKFIKLFKNCTFVNCTFEEGYESYLEDCTIK